MYCRFDVSIKVRTRLQPEVRCRHPFDVRNRGKSVEPRHSINGQCNSSSSCNLLPVPWSNLRSQRNLTLTKKIQNSLSVNWSAGFHHGDWSLYQPDQTNTNPTLFPNKDSQHAYFIRFHPFLLVLATCFLVPNTQAVSLRRNTAVQYEDLN